MKKFAMILALGASAVSMPAFAAGEVSGNVTINGAVASKCLFTTASATITIPELAGSNGALDPATVNNQAATLAGWCNKAASTMSVDATQLTNQDVSAAALQPGFVRAVTYTATAVAKDANGTAITGGTATDTNSTDTLSGTPAPVGMFRGDIVVTLSGAATGSGLLSAGNYLGNVKVTLAPAA